MPFKHVGDIDINYEMEGEGKTLLMIQGLGYDLRPFRWLFDELKKSFRVIAFDNRGAGRSDKPKGPYTVEQMADDAAGLLDALGIEKACVFGVSLGGSIAQTFALRHPTRLEKLVVGCSFFTGNPERLEMPPETVEVLTKRDGTPEEVARKGLAVAFSPSYPPAHPDIYEQLVRWRVESPIPAHGYFAQLQAGMGFDVEKSVSSITAPTLVLHGDLDRVVPVGRGKELSLALPGSRLVIFEGCGHLFFIEEVEKTAALIGDFLERGEIETQLRLPAAGKRLPWHPRDFLAKRASIAPGKIALFDDRSGSRSYGELNDRAERLALFLAAQGVGKGHRVGALALNSIAMVEILFACGKLGAIFVPFNYRLAAGELRGIVEDAAPSLFFVDGPNAALAASIAAALPPPRRVVALDAKAARKKPCLRYDEILAAPIEPGGAPAPAVTGEDPWIICYTGGTTGTPKGAVLTHGSVLWNAVNTITGWGLRDDDVAPVVTPLFHTGGLNVLLTPLLLQGGTCVLVPLFDPEKFLRLLRRRKCTYVFMVPSMYRMMIESPRWEKENFRTVREFVTGGAPCPRVIFEAFAAKKKRFRMGYGLTEAGPNTFFLDPARSLELFGFVGKPLPFIQVRIERDDGTEAGPGETGELLIRGGHVFAGYWRKPDETRKVFSGGWLRTGDLARRDEAGNHAIAGRRKEMFISGGENVFPSEIEEVILRHPAVAEAAVVGVEDEKWGEAGLAAVALRKEAALTADDLRDFLRERLAHYKVPRRFVFLPGLPKTGAGKIDKPRLKADHGPGGGV
jgi:fatty-acyl-CoA synthase